MDEDKIEGKVKDTAKQTAGNLIKKVFNPKRVIIIIAIILICIFLFAAFSKFLKLLKSKNDPKNPKNAPAAVSEYINDTAINENGEIILGKTAQEFWDELKAKGNDVLDYLNSPEDLKKMMNAELVTQYLDTRKNPEEEINWEKINKNVTSKNVQGIIKLKRGLTSGDKITMTYVSPSKFQALVDKYNSSGSEKDKNEALKHFTIEKVSSSDSSIGNAESSDSSKDMVATGNDVITDVSKAILNKANAKSTPSPGAGWCLAWVDNVYSNAGLNPKRTSTAYKAWKTNGISTDRNAIPIGAAVYGTGSGNHPGAGHVGIYIGNGKVVDNVGAIKIWKMDDWLSWQKDVIQGHKGWLGWGWEDGNKTRGTTKDPKSTSASSSASTEKQTSTTSENNNDKTSSSNTDNKKGKFNKNSSGDGYEQTYTSSTGFTYKDFKQGKGTYASHSYWGGKIKGWGCGPTSVAIVASGLRPDLNYTPSDTAKQMSKKYGYTSYTTLKKEMDSLGMKSEVIHNPSAKKIVEQLKAGKVMVVSVDKRTNFPFTSSHIMAIVDVREDGKILVMNPNNKSGANTGWYNPEQVSKGCQYIVVTDSGKVGVASSDSSAETDADTQNSTYVAKIATWTETTDTMKTTVSGNTSYTNNTGDDVENYNNSSHSMSIETVNYQQYVSKFSMSFDYLWMMLLYGEDRDFVMDLAELVENSDFEITVHDNLNIDTNITTEQYTKKTDITTQADVTVKKTTTVIVPNNLQPDSTTNNQQTTTQTSVQAKYKDSVKKDFSATFTKVNTVITKTDRTDIALTKANTWCVDYSQKFTHNKLSTTSNNTSTSKLDDRSDGSTTSSDDPLSAKNTFLSRAANKYPSGNGTIYSYEISGLTTTKDYSTINRSITTHNKVEDSEYVSSPAETKGKDDKNSKDESFITLLAKNYNARSNILSIDSWLFEALEKNDRTKNLVDLTKYLLYKLTGNSYGVTEYDFSTFVMTKVNNELGGNILSVTDTTLTREEFIKKVKSYTPGIKNGATEFMNNAGVIYDICKQEKINPVLAVAQAWMEQNWKTPIPGNYWGIGVYNGTQDGFHYQGVSGGVKGYCNEINNRLNKKNGTVNHRVKEFSKVNNKYNPDVVSIYDVLAAWAWSNNDKNMSWKQRADYDAGYIESIMKCASNIFGEGALTATGYGQSGKYAKASRGEKVKALFPSGVPKSASEMKKYLITVRVPTTSKNGNKTQTNVTIHKLISGDVYNACLAAQNEGFKIYSIGGYREFGTDPAGAMRDYGLNYSQHCYGLAVDVNPNENAMMDNGRVSVGNLYAPGKNEYSIMPNSAFVKAMHASGWRWGAEWSGSRQDYMHFSFMGY